MTANLGITVIVVTFRRWDATRRCLDSVLKYRDDGTNVLIVDNCSPDPMRRGLMEYPGTKLFLDRNIGFYRALNSAMRLVPDELAAVLDCDIVVSPGWLQSLSSEVLSAPDIGLAGSRYLNADGSLQEGYPILRPDGWYGNNSQDLLEAADCQYIAIGCSVIRRSAWERVSGFDEAYFISH